MLPLLAAGALGPACGTTEIGNVFPLPVDAAGGSGNDATGPILGSGSADTGNVQPSTDGSVLAVCGDSRRSRNESCDDGNATGGDGCSLTCEVETGWICAIDGAVCNAARCGDGLRVGDEDCDDGNAASGDGCDTSCKLQDGYQCVTPGAACTVTVCGNGTPEGGEQCDDGNLRAYDGCDPTCHKEPVCTAGAGCSAVCGDGLKYPTESCDDGNTRSGDGCSATCTEEAGFTCATQVQALPDFVDLPVVYRDFKRGDGAANLAASGHPDFQAFCCGSPTGMVAGLLDGDGKPVFLSSQGLLTSPAEFAKWFRDDALNKTELGGLRLKKQADQSYVFDSALSNPDGTPNPSGQFFPLTNKGWTAASVPAAQREALLAGYNYHFTSEVKFWFSHDASAPAPKLEFSGDDDVFVFVNGRLAVDIGGVHGALSKSVTIHPTCIGVPNTVTDVCKIAGTDLGLIDKGVYEIAVFQAERHTDESNYKLTLRGFERAKSVCTPRCGDSVKTRTEACDEGAGNDPSTTPAYGKCAADCRSRGGYCGDGVLQTAGGEQCDGTENCNANCTAGGGPA